MPHLEGRTAIFQMWHRWKAWGAGGVEFAMDYELDDPDKEKYGKNGWRGCGSPLGFTIWCLVRVHRFWTDHLIPLSRAVFSQALTSSHHTQHLVLKPWEIQEDVTLQAQKIQQMMSTKPWPIRCGEIVRTVFGLRVFSCVSKQNKIWILYIYIYIHIDESIPYFDWH